MKNLIRYQISNNIEVRTYQDGKNKFRQVIEQSGSFTEINKFAKLSDIPLFSMLERKIWKK